MHQMVIEKEKVKIGELILIMYLTISSILGLLITISVIWVTLQMKRETDPNPNVGFLYFIMIVPQILGIIIGFIVWLRHRIKNTEYKKTSLIPLALWILSVIMYFVI